ncbi:MAG: Ldh family oxidoreductase [Haloferacaceae archaeon]
MSIEAERLEAAAAALLETTGAPPETAATVARSLVEADLRGHHSHGVLRVPHYAEKVDGGYVDPTAEPVVESTTPTTAAVDGRNAFGQLVGHEAVSLLDERAGEAGVAVVGIRDATHLGRIGEWAERTAANGYCFASFLNSQGGNHNVAPAGSATGKLSTNPLTFAVPTFDALEHDVVLDMATSQVAHGKITEKEAVGEPIPEGWTTDEAGDHFADAAAFEAGEGGAMLPLGGRVAGYKGTGLAVVSELLAGILGGGDVVGQAHPAESNNAAAFVAVDPLAFTTREQVTEKAASVAAHLADADYDTGPSPGVAAKGDRFRMPGAPEHEKAVRYREEGIPLDERILGKLRTMADERGVAVDL